MITLERRIVRGQAQEGGYRRLSVVGGKPRQVRTELVKSGRPQGERRPLLAFAHLSDLHVMDHQSPGRVELLDRYADPDSPIRGRVGMVGSYRPQELFTYHFTATGLRLPWFAVHGNHDNQVKAPSPPTGR